MAAIFKLFKSTLKGAGMLFSSYKAKCMSLLQKYFCADNFDEVSKHLEYMKKHKTDDWDYVINSSKEFASLEFRMINNFTD